MRYAFLWRYSLLREYWFYWRRCRNWRAVIRCRRREGGLNYVELRNGLCISIIESEARSVFLPLLLEIWRDSAYTGLYHGPEPRVVVDVGAHVGFFALYAAHLWRRATILAFEPHPLNFALLQQNIALNDAARIKPFPLAVSRCIGRMRMNAAGQSDSYSLLPETTANGGLSRSVPVFTTTLDGLLALTPHGQIDFLKVDCEGAEFDLFDGQQATLASCVHYCAIEYHERPGLGHEVLVRTLHEAGFEVAVYPSSRLRLGKILARNLSLQAE